MITRLLLLLTCVAGGLSAQFQLYVVNGPADSPVGAQYDVGTLQPGASKDVLFRLKNPGSAATALTILSAAGVGFSIPKPPVLPKTVPAGGAIDFTVHFAPTGSGFFSAILTAGDASTILVGSEATGAARGTVYLAQPDGSRLPINPGDTVDFGSIPRQASVERDFINVNETGAPLTILNVALAGSYFALADPGVLPVTLAAGAFVTIRVVFEPQFPGTFQATVRIEHQDYFLSGEAIDEFPQPGITLDIGSARSGQQGRLAVYLPSPSPVSGEGTVTLAFVPAVSGVIDDPGVMFLTPSNSKNNRSVTFTVNEGDVAAKFGGAAMEPNTSFQTGTTAGDLVFTAQLPNGTDQKRLTIPRAAIGVDTVTATRVAAGLNVSINGFDNTRTASQFTFTFYTVAGTAIAPGAINVDLTTNFANYFTKAQFGGVFGLHAVFPVTGDSTQIDSVSVVLVNTIGKTNTGKIKITTP
jgi:hypothetical protein